MKARFKCCDRKVKSPFEYMMESCKGVNPLVTMFYKQNSDYFNKLYGDISKGIIIHHKKHHTNCGKVSEKPAEISEPTDISKSSESDTFEKHEDTNKVSDEDYFKQDLEILPASEHDTCNYFARYGTANYQIQAILKLDGRLDFGNLKRAVRLSVDAEPVFGCRFVEDKSPYWKRLDNLDEITLCSLEETDDVNGAVMGFLQRPMYMDKDPMVIVRLIRSEQSDTLGVKVNHTCCDGTGTKEYIQLLSDIYSRLDEGKSDFIPKPRIGNRKDQLFEESGVIHPELKWKPSAGTPKTAWAFPWSQRGGNTVCYEVCRLPKGSLESIHQYGKSRGATVNDLILTAYYRTMFKISRPIYGIPMDISSTIDMRRYLPEQRTQVIRNFSGGFVTKVARIMNEPFDGTLARVTRSTIKAKDGYPDLNSTMGGEYAEKADFTYFQNYFESISRAPKITDYNSAPIGKVCYPALSNVGYISTSLIRFGKYTVTDAYIIPPAVRAPGFLLLAGSYNGVLTLSTGYYRGSLHQKDMEGLLNMIKNELLRSCSY